MTLEPAAEFLLNLSYPNLFEPTGSGETDFRCKGCGALVQRRHRQQHHDDHRREPRHDTNGGAAMALEVKQETVDRIVKDIKGGKGLTAVAKALNEERVPVPGRAKTWYAPTVRNIFLKATGLSGVKEQRDKKPLKRTAAPAKASAKTSSGKRTVKADPKVGKAQSRTTRKRTSRKR